MNSSEPLASRYKARFTKWGREFSRDLLPVLPIFLGWRLALQLAAWLAPRIRPFGGPSRMLMKLGETVPNWLARWFQWDSGWYLLIAHEGYLDAYAFDKITPAFFPLYPVLVRTISDVTLMSMSVSGLILSNACALGFFLFCYRLAGKIVGGSNAKRAVAYVAFFPASFFLVSFMPSRCCYCSWRPP